MVIYYNSGTKLNIEYSTPHLSILFFSYTLFIYIDKNLGNPYMQHKNS
jgi:hypothetical protein